MAEVLEAGGHPIMIAHIMGQLAVLVAVVALFTLVVLMLSLVGLVGRAFLGKVTSVALGPVVLIGRQVAVAVVLAELALTAQLVL
jgi:hypothetical protein